MTAYTTESAKILAALNAQDVIPKADLDKLFDELHRRTDNDNAPQMRLEGV